MHEFMGGVRLSVPSRVTPYAVGTIGAVRLVNFSSSVSSPSTQLAVGAGLGLNIRIRHRIGVAVELHAVHAVSTEICVIRPTAGMYYRFLECPAESWPPERAGCRREAAIRM